VPALMGADYTRPHTRRCAEKVASLDAFVFIRGGAPQALADLGFPQRRFMDRISVRQPTETEVQGLDLPPDVPVFRQFRVVYSDGERPVEVSVLIKGGHLYELSYRQTAD
jgi:GntR family transcriptional regulator